MRARSLATSPILVDPSRKPSGTESTPGRPLARNFSWTLFGNLVFAAAQWAVVMVLAKLTTPAEVGQFALAAAVAAPVILFANSQLRSILATDVAHENQVGDYLGFRLLTAAAAVLVIAIVAVTGGYSSATAWAIVLAGLNGGLSSISDVLYGVLDRNERMDRVGLGSTIRGLLVIVAFTSAVYFTGSLIGGLIAWIAVYALMLFLYDAPNAARMIPAGRRGLAPRWEGPRLLRIARTALPLGLVAMVGALGVQLPRYFLGHVIGERELGIFAALVYPVSIGGMLAATLGYSVMPRLARCFAAGDLRAFRLLLLKLAGASAALAGMGVLVAVVAGRPILALLYTPEYASHSGLFVWIMAAAGIGYVTSTWDTAMLAARCFKAQLPLACVTLLASAVACAWAIPVYGIKGGAFGMMGGAVTHAMGGVWVLRRALANRARAE